MRITFIILAVSSFAAVASSCSGTQPAGPAAVDNAGRAAAVQPASTPEAAYVFRRKPAPADGAGAEVAGAKLVEGKILGLIVQKGELKESVSEKDPSKKSYTVSYYLTNGDKIAAIDEAGVHKETDEVLFINVAQDGTPPEDDDAVQTGMGQADAPGMPVMMAFTAGGGTAIRMSGRSKSKRSTDANALLGEYRLDPGTNKGKIYPEVKVETEGGPVTVPVGSFIKFRKQPEAATPPPTGKK